MHMLVVRHRRPLELDRSTRPLAFGGIPRVIRPRIDVHQPRKLPSMLARLNSGSTVSNHFQRDLPRTFTRVTPHQSHDVRHQHH